MRIRLSLLSALLLAPSACARNKPAAPAPPQWDAQWDAYSTQLKQDEENAKRLRAGGGPAPVKTCSGAPAPVSPKVIEPLAEAKQAMYDGKYQNALDRTEVAIGLDPGSAASWEVRGSAFYTLGRLGEAKLAWTRAFELDPCLKEIPVFLEKIKDAAAATPKK